MKKYAPHRLKSLLLVMVTLIMIFANLPSAYAFDSTKIVLSVSDKSGYNSPELNAALLGKLRSQFRFPKYEIILTDSKVVAPDRLTLEKITNDAGAEGTVIVEINFLRNYLQQSLLGDEMVEVTDLNLSLTYFDKKTSQHGQFKAVRSATEIAGVFSGPLPLALDALEEMLNRLDKIFPRQFPGSRY